MSLSALPTEMVWSILDQISRWDVRKNASLVCRSWNQMLFNSPGALQNINLCIWTGKREPAANVKVFSEFLRIMMASERKYVNVEFFHVDYELPITEDLLQLVVSRNQESIKCLEFTHCKGLVRTALLSHLTTAYGLKELHIQSQIDYDEGPLEQFQLPGLCVVKLCVPEPIQGPESYTLVGDLCWLAPNLKELSIVPYPNNMLLVSKTIAHFSSQLTKLECCIENVEDFSRMEFTNLEFTNLVELNFKTNGLIDATFISKLKRLKLLSVRGKMTDRVMLAIGTLHGLECLSLRSIEHYRCYLSRWKKLQNLKKLLVRGCSIYWAYAKFPMLQSLQIGEPSYDFLPFLEDSRITSLELYETFWNNQLGAACRLLPGLERLELIKCRNVKEEDFKNISLLPSLVELRLWCVKGVSDSVFQQWEKAPLEKLFIYCNPHIFGRTLKDFATRLPHLKQAVFIKCPNIQSEAIQALRSSLPSCDVLEIRSGDRFPPSLKQDSEEYNINADHPDGFLAERHTNCGFGIAY